MLNPRPTSPGQLPPSTEGFTFYNLSSFPVAVHALTVKDAGGTIVHGPDNVGPVAPGETKNIAIPPVPGTEVSCTVRWAAGGPPQTLEMRSEPMPGSEKISQSVYGVHDSQDGGVHGWGVDILDNGINLGL